jgi:hypothetical protein
MLLNNKLSEEKMVIVAKYTYLINEYNECLLNYDMFNSTSYLP